MENREFLFKPSVTYISLQALVMLVTVGIIALLPLPLVIRASMQALLFVYILFIVRRHGFLRAPNSIRSIKRLDGKRFRIRTVTSEFEGLLLGDSVMSRWVSILRFSVQGQRSPYVCIIWSDSLPNDEYRQFVAVVGS